LSEGKEAEEGAKLEILCAAAQLGAAVFDSGDFAEFSDTDAMIAYLENVAQQVCSRGKDE
jgi:hypothetical protein